VIFDMDGVLLDSEPIHAEATRRILAAEGIDYEQDPSLIGLTDDEIFALFRRRYGLATDEAELGRRFVAEVVEMLAREAAPLPGVEAVLTGLRRDGRRLALASSSTPDVIGATLDALGFRPHFDAVVSGVEVPRGKPAPDIFLEAARRLGVDPPRCLVVEDSFNGVRAAKAAGMACVAIPCGPTLGHDLSAADVVLERIAALPELLRRRGRRPE